MNLAVSSQPVQIHSCIRRFEYQYFLIWPPKALQREKPFIGHKNKRARGRELTLTIPSMSERVPKESYKCYSAQTQQENRTLKWKAKDRTMIAYPMDGGIVSLLLSPIRMPEDSVYTRKCNDSLAKDTKCTDQQNQVLSLQKITINPNIPPLYNLAYTCKTKRR